MRRRLRVNAAAAADAAAAASAEAAQFYDEAQEAQDEVSLQPDPPVSWRGRRRRGRPRAAARQVPADEPQVNMPQAQFQAQQMPVSAATMEAFLAGMTGVQTALQQLMEH